MTQRWVYSEPSDETEALMSLINVPRPIAQILLNRGVHTFDQARLFLKPTLDDLHDPFLMKDMDTAIDRIVSAVDSGESMMVFGDYDVDGTTATTLLYLVLSSLSEKVSYYIPDRLSEGYGLSDQAMGVARKNGVSLIISVDCGITANREIELAQKEGLDVIVVDHHVPGETLPDGFAIINPKRDDCPYPFKELCGVGLAYKVSQALAHRLELHPEIIDSHLDLVALGTTADIVPLHDENRVLTKFGLSTLHQTDKVGLQALIRSAGMKERELSTGQVVFGLAPRINAAGRMGDANRVVKLLTTEDWTEAEALSDELNAENARRRQQDSSAFEEAKKIVEADPFLKEAEGIVLSSDQWHPGIIGIVASRIVETYSRPAVIIAINGDTGRGSGRTMGDFHLYDALKECEDLLEQFGGHHHAAGLTIKTDRIPEFRQRFHEIVSRRATPLDFIPTLPVDTEIEFEEVNPRLMRLLKMLAPFGPENRHPVMVSKDLSLVGQPSVIGSEKRHLKFRVRQGDHVLEAIGFGMADHAKQLRANPDKVSLAYALEENTWNGKTSIQLRIKDIKAGDSA
ncbi:MAG: single-stranded-DNA-specific exonuclease RecJ [Candidatus Latescibacteria bacterium]|jgi:single-stranded-DNA-specific exonuclease|nr:single-stranded-DNA-specific exonuclease RecJ [Candidatus Latescibacterota bacterium]